MKRTTALFSLRAKSSDIVKDEEGLALIEFAISLGVLLIMFFGAIEVSRYILIVQKVEKTVDTLTDVLSQTAAKEVAQANIKQYLNATQELMNPYTFGASGRVILSDIYFPANSTTPTVKWQVCGGGTLAADSVIAPGGPNSAANQAAFPSGFKMDPLQPTEEIILGEIFYNFQPLFIQQVVTSSQVYRVAIFKPRYYNLTVTSSGC